MKHFYISIVLVFLGLTSFAQGYQFELIHISGNSFKVVAIPDFDSSGNTDVSDVGFTLMLPAGDGDVINPQGLLGGRAWNVYSNANATVLLDYGGDGTEDAFLVHLGPGQVLLQHSVGEQIDLVSFEISNMPTSGVIRFLLNTEAIAINLNRALDSFYNSNIDSTNTNNYFAGISFGTQGMNGYMFSTLGVEEVVLADNFISIYPNPIKDVLHIKGKDAIKSVTIYDVSGRLINQVSFIGHQTEVSISTEQLSQGAYFAKVKTEMGEGVRKIIKE